jgi:hypothetical protein
MSVIPMCSWQHVSDGAAAVIATGPVLLPPTLTFCVLYQQSVWPSSEPLHPILARRGRLNRG